MKLSTRRAGSGKSLPRGGGGLILALIGALVIVFGLRSAPDPATVAGAATAAASQAAAGAMPVAFTPSQMMPVVDFPPLAATAQVMAPMIPVAGFQPLAYPPFAAVNQAAAPFLPATGFQQIAGNPALAMPQAFTPPAPLRTPPRFRMIPFVEAHWQGLEMIQLTPALAKALGIDPNIKGIVADDVTPPADACGFLGADMVVAINGVPTNDLDAFIAASNLVHEQRKVTLTVVRKGQTFPLTLWALQQTLGAANGETAPMIPSGSVSPHAYQGACTGCHRIGTKGQLPVDQGDLLAKSAPVIKAGSTAPHRDRGNCLGCHKIVP